MRPEWSRLTPDQALEGFEEAYVPRRIGGDRLAVLVRSGLAPLAVTGPDGSGKSTELNRARVVLAAQGKRVLPFKLGELWDQPDLDGHRVMFGLAECLVDRTVDLEPNFQPAQGLIADLRASDPGFPRGHGKRRPPMELVVGAVAEVQKFYGVGRLAVFVDGLDELEPALAREVLRQLLRTQELVHLVVVASPTLVNGPDNQSILTHVRLFPVPVPPVRDVEGLVGDEGRAFLVAMALGRLDLDREPSPRLLRLLDRVARYSGGLPRTYLRLLRDAGLYAGIEHRALPSRQDVADAVRDAAGALRRLLQAGDLEALAASEGTAGLEVPPDRRVRFLAHALLLEYARGDDLVVLPHPLLERLIARETGQGYEE